ncbi:DgyrCDS14707 [Dimorphilus gyrociliatus]|uniref:DgyrCDS14707 n=1 Tax=Dimorphilus gyrociliatus TaxID=2664684 RepID=A0A7I8WEK4_9ANNE|nr:DgyrCDS14707 [Dimorphilus gyrociliatus]
MIIRKGGREDAVTTEKDTKKSKTLETMLCPETAKNFRQCTVKTAKRNLLDRFPFLISCSLSPSVNCTGDNAVIIYHTCYILLSERYLISPSEAGEKCVNNEMTMADFPSLHQSFIILFLDSIFKIRLEKKRHTNSRAIAYQHFRIRKNVKNVTVLTTSSDISLDLPKFLFGVPQKYGAKKRFLGRIHQTEQCSSSLCYTVHSSNGLEKKVYIKGINCASRKTNRIVCQRKRG